MKLEDLADPRNSNELYKLITKFYGEEISIEEFINTIKTSRDETIALIKKEDTVFGYLLWSVEKEIDEEEDEILDIVFNIDELALLEEFEEDEENIEIIELLEKKANNFNCTLIELSIPSQSFRIIPIFLESEKYELSNMRVSKELERKTEFVKIYTEVKKNLDPQLIQLLVSKNDIYQLELIEEPTDYKQLLEEGYNPEIVSLIFDLEEVTADKIFENINSIAEWQEFTITLLSYLQ